MTDRVDIDVETGRVTYSHEDMRTWDDARPLVLGRLREHGQQLGNHERELGRLHSEQQNIHVLLAHNNRLIQSVSELIAHVHDRIERAGIISAMLIVGLTASIGMSVLILWRLTPK